MDTYNKIILSNTHYTADDVDLPEHVSCIIKWFMKQITNATGELVQTKSHFIIYNNFGGP